MPAATKTPNDGTKSHSSRPHRGLTLKHRKRRTNKHDDDDVKSSWKAQARPLLLPLLVVISFVFLNFEMKQIRAALSPNLLGSATAADGTVLNLYSYGKDLLNNTYFDWKVDDILGNWTFLWNPLSTTTSSSSQQQQNHQRDNAFAKLPLKELVQPHQVVECPVGLTQVQAVINQTAEAMTDRKIPRIVHQTGKTRCLTPVFLQATEKWKLPGWSYYFHDDEAIERLFNKDWKMFPQLKNTLSCMQGNGGAAFADLWRYLALWEYGGIYTDMDCAPNTLLELGNAILPEMDAFFLQEGGGFLSQYFFAVAPHHPLMYLAVADVLHKMHDLDDRANFYVPVITGPGALKRAFLRFMGTTQANSDEKCRKYCKPSKGHYVGVVAPNWTVDVVSTRGNNQEFVIRDAISGFQKKKQWQKMGAEDYNRNPAAKKPVEPSCLMHLHNRYETERQQAENISTTVARRERR